MCCSKVVTSWRHHGSDSKALNLDLGRQVNNITVIIHLRVNTDVDNKANIGTEGQSSRTKHTQEAIVMTFGYKGYLNLRGAWQQHEVIVPQWVFGQRWMSVCSCACICGHLLQLDIITKQKHFNTSAITNILLLKSVFFMLWLHKRPPLLPCPSVICIIQIISDWL